jgi:hypothetical protein
MQTKCQRKAIALVGARKTPNLILTLMELLGYRLASEGWECRSGDAKGADYAFYRGIRSYCEKIHGFDSKHLAKIYIPWNGFEGAQGPRYDTDLSGHFINFQSTPNRDRAYTMAATVHPNWGNCSQGSRSLHARNVYQVYSETLDHPIKALICWAPLDGDSIKGGTRTAWELARRAGARLINLNRTDDYEWALRFLMITEARLKALAGE